MYCINLYCQNLNCEDEGDEDVKDNGECKGKKNIAQNPKQMNNWNARCFVFK